jgi:hypothetical protein
MGVDDIQRVGVVGSGLMGHGIVPGDDVRSGR